jgi:DNA-binding MarR family transcriptional regulator
MLYLDWDLTISNSQYLAICNSNLEQHVARPQNRNPNTPAVSDDPLAHLPGYALRRAANAMMAELGSLLDSIDLRISEASILLLIDGRDDMTSSAIGSVLDIRSANMVPLLNRLSNAGLIDKVRIDGKSMAIVLSAKGREKAAEVRVVTDNFESDLLRRIPAAHRPHLVPALNALWR